MPIPLTLKRLLQIRDPAVDQAIAAALPSVSPGEQDMLARALLDRGDAMATASLIERFEQLPEKLQTELISRIGQLHGACREAARRRGTPGPRMVIDLVRRTGSCKLVYLVAEQLRTGPVELRREAARCLLHLTEQVVAQAATASEGVDQHDDEPASIAESRNDMQAAIEEGLLLYRHHHQPAVLLAFAMLLPGPCGKAMSALGDPRQPAVEGLRQLILDAHEPPIIGQMLRWLTVATLQPVATAALPRLCRAGKLAMVLEQGELLLLGPTRQALSKVADPSSLLPGDAELHAMPESCARWLPHWIAALPLDEATRIAQLARLGTLPHASARLAALRALMQMPLADKLNEDELQSAIALFCDDSSEAVAVAAADHLLSSSWSGLHRLLFKLNRESSHESLRTLAADHLASIGFDGLWRSWSRLSQTQRFAAGKALLKLDDRFHRLLDQRLACDDQATRIKAMDIIASLNQGALFEETLIAMARNSDEKLAASAVRALASAQSQEATFVLEASLAHGSARVRANAIEALNKQRINRSIATLRNMAASEENRPRANAIARLLHIGDAQASTRLRDMLADVQPHHRISALWAVEHEGRLESLGEVAEMFITDGDAQVRRRAGRTLKQLIGLMQSA